MAKFEPIEVIMRLSEARASDKGEICIQADKVQDLVRCKDCKHYFKNDRGNVVTYECELLHDRMRDDFFCADGERHDR